MKMMNVANSQMPSIQVEKCRRRHSEPSNLVTGQCDGSAIQTYFIRSYFSSACTRSQYRGSPKSHYSFSLSQPSSLSYSWKSSSTWAGWSYLSLYKAVITDYRYWLLIIGHSRLCSHWSACVCACLRVCVWKCVCECVCVRASACVCVRARVRV